MAGWMAGWLIGLLIDSLFEHGMKSGGCFLLSHHLHEDQRTKCMMGAWGVANKRAAARWDGRKWVWIGGGHAVF
jgi:hypothetical protein